MFLDISLLIKVFKNINICLTATKYKFPDFGEKLFFVSVGILVAHCFNV